MRAVMAHLGMAELEAIRKTGGAPGFKEKTQKARRFTQRTRSFLNISTLRILRFLCELCGCFSSR
jgi:hypothetical protein